jgi:hypothetical protein
MRSDRGNRSQRWQPETPKQMFVNAALHATRNDPVQAVRWLHANPPLLNNRPQWAEAIAELEERIERE